MNNIINWSLDKESQEHKAFKEQENMDWLQARECLSHETIIAYCLHEMVGGTKRVENHLLSCDQCMKIATIVYREIAELIPNIRKAIKELA